MFIYKISKKVFYTEDGLQGEVMEKCKKDYVDCISKAVHKANSHLSDIEMEICSTWEVQHDQVNQNPISFPRLTAKEFELVINQKNAIYSLLEYKCQYHTFYTITIELIIVH